MVFGFLKKGWNKAKELGKKVASKAIKQKIGRKASDPASVYDQLGGEDQEMAKLSQAAYGKGGDPLKRDKDTAGWALDNDLSGNNAAVYTKDGKVSISYRGTDFKNKGDVKADAYIMAGKQKHSERFKEAEDLYKRARTKYGDTAKFRLTGHSLGGSQASHVARKFADKHDTTASVFNPGRGLDLKHMANRAKCAVGMGNKKKCRAVRTHAIKGDPISILDQSNRKQYATNRINAHTIDNFLPPGYRAAV